MILKDVMATMKPEMNKHAERSDHKLEQVLDPKLGAGQLVTHLQLTEIGADCKHRALSQSGD